MSQGLLEVCGLLVVLVVLTAAFHRALQPLLRRLVQGRLGSAPFASSAGVRPDAAQARRDAPERLGSPA